MHTRIVASDESPRIGRSCITSGRVGPLYGEKQASPAPRTPMRSTIVKSLIAVTVLGWTVGFVALPAFAAPTAQTVTVYQTPCDSSPCGASGSGDSALSSSALVKDTIQIVARASSTAGLSYVRLQASPDAGKTWICLANWNTSSTNYQNHFDWGTSKWPGSSGSAPAGCPSSGVYGTLTRNGSYQLRVQAADALGTTNSGTFAVRVNNKPSVPTWSDSPTVDGQNSNQPVVTLRWDANPEPDMVEYHYVRTNPDGTQVEYAVSATSPGGQGCDRDGTGYICYDDDFPSSQFGGTYSYSLIAYRSSPATSADPCAIGSGNCIASSQSDDTSIQIDEPPPPSPGQATGGGGGGTRKTGSGVGTTKSSGGTTTRHASGTGGGTGHTYCDFYCGSFKSQLPYDQRQVLIPSGNGKRPIFAAGPTLGTGIDIGEQPNKRLWFSLAAGLLLMLCAAHMARLLRDNAI